MVAIWKVDRIAASILRAVHAITRCPDVVGCAVMPDVHHGPRVPNGLVVATSTLIYPEWIGSDIGCGYSAVRIRYEADRLTTDQLRSILNELHRAVPAQKRIKSQVAKQLPAGCHASELSGLKLRKAAERDGLYQLGTLGRGNHFVELLKDDSDVECFWVLVHSGSRAMGQYITEFHLQRAAAQGESNYRNLDSSNESGEAYWNDMSWAVCYARQNRHVILNGCLDTVEKIIGADLEVLQCIDCPHNFAARQEVDGNSLIVHRKSANSAMEGEVGIIAGSMGTFSCVTKGRGCADAFFSSSHGAGRQFSRTQAVEALSLSDMKARMRSVVYNERVANKMLDESPDAYRDLRKVLRAQRQLVKVCTELTPILNYKRVIGRRPQFARRVAE